MARHDSTVTVHFKVDEDSTRQFTERLNAMAYDMQAVPRRRYDQAIAAAERATALTEDVTARLEKMKEDRDHLLAELTRRSKDCVSRETYDRALMQRNIAEAALDRLKARLGNALTNSIDSVLGAF